MTTAQSQTKTAQTNAAEIARLKTMRTVAIVLAVVSFLTLVFGFGEKWQPIYQVVAGLVAYGFIEWQRRCHKKIKELGGA
jgi:hypothetical protein